MSRWKIIFMSVSLCASLRSAITKAIKAERLSDMGNWPILAPLIHSPDCLDGCLFHGVSSFGSAIPSRCAARPPGAPAQFCQVSVRSLSRAAFQRRSTCSVAAASQMIGLGVVGFHSLFSRNLVLHHPALMIGLSSVAAQHLENR